ncbi:MAG: cation transporter [Methanotrichaceae archaeon]|nr:cation transporter [Methanotrichaceae archaeon]
MVIKKDSAGKRKASVALLSVASNSALVMLKLGVGMMIGSVSVISEAIRSGVDLIAAVIAFLAVRNSGKPADLEHPFWHGTVENVSGIIAPILPLDRRIIYRGHYLYNEFRWGTKFYH